MTPIEEARAFVLAHPRLMLGAALDTVAGLLVKFGDEARVGVAGKWDKIVAEAEVAARVAAIKEARLYLMHHIKDWTAELEAVAGNGLLALAGTPLPRDSRLIDEARREARAATRAGAARWSMISYMRCTASFAASSAVS